MAPNEVKLNKMDTIPEKNMADISLHALIRHQNQRRIKISPVPAPNIIIISNIWVALVSNKATIAPRSMMIKVVILPTLTSLFSEASGFIKRL